MDFCDSNVLAGSVEILLANIFMILLIFMILVRVLLMFLGWIFYILMILE